MQPGSRAQPHPPAGGAQAPPVAGDQRSPTRSPALQRRRPWRRQCAPPVRPPLRPTCRAPTTLRWPAACRYFCGWSPAARPANRRPDESATQPPGLQTAKRRVRRRQNARPGAGIRPRAGAPISARARRRATGRRRGCWWAGAAALCGRKTGRGRRARARRWHPRRGERRRRSTGRCGGRARRRARASRRWAATSRPPWTS
mmetsp:Transcript_5374/g.17882  ORF Transcript_5374/g.17882 Transcript_5374/m.17882 type:complete len:201 (-) Transcript_5374:452-1054(-)